LSLGFDDYGKNNSENNIEQSSSENVEVVKYTPDSIYTSQLVKDVILQSEGKNSKKNKKALIATVVTIVIILICIISTTLLLLGKGWLSNRLFTNERVQITIPVQKKPSLENKYYDSTTGKYTTEGVAKKVLPSVVSIEIFEKGTTFSPVSQGSGIILTENGYIITNEHVIENATRAIKVILDNGEEYEAKIVGLDKKTDLAVIKINKTGLVAADFGDSDELEIGEEIVAIGSPAGLYGSLTRGVVSGLNRMIKTDANNIEMNCIQIDAAINPGNSGGALVNMYGQVVGINTSKVMADSYDGIGFAISINAARPILEELIAEGYVKDRVRVGITFYEVTEATAKINGTKTGLLISSIDKDCDIANTNLRVNDIITHIDGNPVIYRSDVDSILKNKKPGDTVTATVYRKTDNGEETTFEIKFKLMEDTSYKIPLK
jgi:serine protease Do